MFSALKRVCVPYCHATNSEMAGNVAAVFSDFTTMTLSGVGLAKVALMGPKYLAHGINVARVELSAGVLFEVGGAVDLINDIENIKDSAVVK